MGEKDDKRVKKNFDGVLVLNWKSGAMRVTKKKPKRLGPWEIPIQIDINVIIPKPPEIKAKGEVEVPEYKVNEMLVETL